MTAADRPDPIIFPTAAEFRDWLEANHDKATELWVGYYRKGVDKKSMTYVQAVDEALCYGWIDGLTRRFDEEVTAQRFTPRRPTSNWSAINIGKVARLTAEGRMQPAGIRAFEGRDRRRDAPYSYEREPLELSDAFRARLEADPEALHHWEAETTSFRRQAADWVMAAKREDTRDRRFGELLEAARTGRRPRPWLVTRERRAGPRPDPSS